MTDIVVHRGKHGRISRDGDPPRTVDHGRRFGRNRESAVAGFSRNVSPALPSLRARIRRRLCPRFFATEIPAAEIDCLVLLDSLRPRGYAEIPWHMVLQSVLCIARIFLPLRIARL